MLKQDEAMPRPYADTPFVGATHGSPSIRRPMLKEGEASAPPPRRQTLRTGEPGGALHPPPHAETGRGNASPLRRHPLRRGDPWVALHPPPHAERGRGKRPSPTKTNPSHGGARGRPPSAAACGNRTRQCLAPTQTPPS